MMLMAYVRIQNGWDRMWRSLREEKGLTAIEYGVFAAFVVLLLVGAAVIIGPKLKVWITGTIDCITTKNKAGCDYGA